jgi:hypothetical protein
MDKSDSFRDEVSELHDSHKRYDNTQDRIDMDRLGKKQELKRNFRLLSIFSFMCVAMSCWVFVIRYVLEWPCRVIRAHPSQCLNPGLGEWRDGWVHCCVHLQLFPLFSNRDIAGGDVQYSVCLPLASVGEFQTDTIPGLPRGDNIVCCTRRLAHMTTDRLWQTGRASSHIPRPSNSSATSRDGY